MFKADALTIDHLIPLSLGGLDEPINYVTCCVQCNQSKSNLPLDRFARTINIPVEKLPVHGDPVIDNERLPIQIRLIRKRVFDKMRSGIVRVPGSETQKRIEKLYRMDFWKTPEGQMLENEFKGLPGQVRIMIPEIQTIAKNQNEFFLLVELAKSAKTRNLIGSVLTPDCDISARLASVQSKTPDESLRKKIEWARARFERNIERWDFEHTRNMMKLQSSKQATQS